MMRFVKVRATKLVLFVCFFIAATVVHAEYSSSNRHPSDLFRWSKCVYRDVQFNAGDFVKTGEPCLNCTCNYGAIVCHLRMCTPIPNPPPSGCFILHKKNMCCPELVCNDDNNILLDGLEGRSRPGSNDDTEVDVANLTKIRSCVINGTTYADGSALSSSTDCRYCFCLKGQEQCVKPTCILQLPECTPVFSQHACCPVKYNCHGSDNVTIISTELSSITTIVPEFDSTEKLLSSDEKNRDQEQNTKSGGTTTTRLVMTTRMIPNESIDNEGTAGNAASFENSYIAHTSPVTAPSSSSSNTLLADTNLTNDVIPPAIEAVTEISTSISLIKTELTVKENEFESQSFTAERRNTIAESESALISDSTQPYDRTSHANVSTRNEIPSPTVKTIPPEIEAILNITKKKEENDFELDYDEPTLPPSLPNLKIIPFVAADAVDKPKEATMEHREDLFVTSDVTDPVIDPLMALQPGSFSPPVKTEGGFVPRVPTLDGPYFESSFNNVYHHQTTDTADIVSVEQAPLPSITEPPKIVENGICTNGQLTYRHGELTSEPKACNMCLCLYGEIICQKPECVPVQAGCRRINYGDVNNCCGEVICDGESSTFSASTETKKIIPFSSTPDHVNSTENQITINSHSDVLSLPEILTVPPAIPTIMTIKVKSKNDTKIDHKYKITIGNNSTQTSTTTAAATTVVTTKASTSTNPPNHPSNLKVDSFPTTTGTTITTTEKTAEPDYDGDGFSFENMLSFLFDEPSTQKPKNISANATTSTTFRTHTFSNPTTTTSTTTITPSTTPTTTTSTISPSTTTVTKPTALIELLTIRMTTETSSRLATSPPLTQETDSIIYMIKNDNQYPKEVINYTDEQPNSIKEINTYYVPPLGNFEEVILNPIKKPNSVTKKPPVKTNPYFSTTYRPRYTTAKVIPLNRPSEKSTPHVIAGDPGAASGLLKLSGCNIFGRMYRLGKIIAELSGPCLQCMCADVGVHCIPLKC